MRDGRVAQQQDQQRAEQPRAASARHQGRSRESAPEASSAMRSRKSVPISALKRCASGDASTSRPKAGASALGPQRDQRDRHRGMRLGQPVGRLEAGVQAAVRRRQRGGQRLHVVADPLGIRLVEVVAVAVPDLDRRLRHQEQRLQLRPRSASAAPRGSRVVSRPRVQRCRRSAVTTFSVPWRTMSITRCSSALIFSRSISAWRSCRLTARLPCGLVSCTWRQQLRMALEEVGRVRQVVGDVVFGDGVHGVVS